MSLECVFPPSCSEPAAVVTSGFSLCSAHRDRVLELLAHQLERVTAADVKPVRAAMERVDALGLPGEPDALDLPDDFDPDELLEGPK